jgi:ABC-type Zn uptake system ZnuABC Zn-binding protein ZnuA
MACVIIVINEVIVMGSNRSQQSKTQADQVAGESGAQVVSLYTGSLSEPGGDAKSYLDFMRYNVSAIVESLK